MSMFRLASCTSLREPLARVRTLLPFAVCASWLPAGAGCPAAPCPATPDDPLLAVSAWPAPPAAVVVACPVVVVPCGLLVVGPWLAVVVPCGLLVVGPWLAVAPPVVGPWLAVVAPWLAPA